MCVRVYTGDNGSDLHYHLGSQISLLCEVSHGPLQDSSVQWVFQHDLSNSSEKEVILNEDTTRGGVLINTWHQDRDIIISNLTLFQVAKMNHNHK